MNDKIKTALIGTLSIGAFMAMAPASSGTPAVNSMNHELSYHDEETVTEKRDLKQFNKIKVLGAVAMDVTAGESQTVTIEVQKDYLDYIKTYVEDGTLIVDMSKKKKKYDWNGHGPKITITMDVLDAIELDGAMDGDFKNLKSDNFVIDLKGAGNLELDGSCGNLTVNLKGAGNIEAEDFKCETADINLKGAGNIEAFASKSVDVRLGGIGNVEIFGKPQKISKNKDGFGHIDIH